MSIGRLCGTEQTVVADSDRQEGSGNQAVKQHVSRMKRHTERAEYAKDKAGNRDGHVRQPEAPPGETDGGNSNSNHHHRQ